MDYKMQKDDTLDTCSGPNKIESGLEGLMARPGMSADFRHGGSLIWNPQPHPMQTAYSTIAALEIWDDNSKY